jgi:hypothetical protein
MRVHSYAFIQTFVKTKSDVFGVSQTIRADVQFCFLLRVNDFRGSTHELGVG